MESRTGTPARTVRRRQARLDAAAAGIWCFGAAVVYFWAFFLSYQESAPDLPTRQEFAARFSRFDFVHFDEIARLGYLPPREEVSTAAPLYAFFPAVPMLLRLGLVFSLSTVTTGLVVSFLSGLVACIWLRRIAERYQPGLGLKAVTALVTAPPAVFLYIPYTESLFLALGLGAWYFGMSGRWGRAGLLCAAACTVRISAAFLLAGLVTMWVMQVVASRRAGDAPRRGSGWVFAMPIAVLAGWMGYLAIITGDLFAYQTAQQYWLRRLVWPWEAFMTTLKAYPPTWGTGFMGVVEIIALGSGIVVLVVLLMRRLYPESVYMALNVATLGAGSFYGSVPRSALLWFPMWIGIAYLVGRFRIVFGIYVLFSLCLMVAWANLFLSGQWAG